MHPQDMAQPLMSPHPQSREESYEGLVVSSRYDLLVMRCSCRELKPLKVDSVHRVRVHASLRKRSSKRSLRRGAATMTGVSGCCATSIVQHICEIIVPFTIKA